MRTKGAALGAALLAATGFAPAGMYAQSAPAQAATVTITDSGFTPATVNIGVGGAVTWINKGNNVHTATTTNNPNTNQATQNPAPFDSGGLGPGQSFSFAFPQAGIWTYSSYPDCMNNNSTPGFSCATYMVVVGTPPSIPPGGGVPAPLPVTVPVGQTVNQNAAVNISDKGFDPPQVTIQVGGSVNFVNQGTTVHTAVSGSIRLGPATLMGNSGPVITSVPPPFDTGGLAPGQNDAITFPAIGTYVYSSATDCLNGNNNPSFNCSGPYTINVVQAPVGSQVSATAPPFSGPIIYIRDRGYDPQSLTITAGQTVTWLSLTNTAHTVTSSDMNPPFDSGGLTAGSVFTVTFQNPGTYHYHSSADAPGSPFSGTITVD
jgi:plastocyanin